jgi:hypothetical protein
VKFTASGSLREKLELARDLMRHANPKGDLAVVLERAVDLLVAELQKQRQGRTSRPQKKPRPAKDSEVTRAARREVVARDGWRCSFVVDDGRRCDARGFLEFDHETPKGRGGSSGAKNLRVLCRAHNRLAAERVYGKAHVSSAISASRRKTGKALVTSPEQKPLELLRSCIVYPEGVGQIVQERALGHRDLVIHVRDGGGEHVAHLAAHRIIRELTRQSAKTCCRTLGGDALLGASEHRAEVRGSDPIVQLSEGTPKDVDFRLLDLSVGAHREKHHFAEGAVLADQHRRIGLPTQARPSH